MSRASLMERCRYRFDTFMTKGTVALLGGLFVASAVLVAAVAAFVLLTGQAPDEDGAPLGFLALSWMGLLRTLDTGTMGGDAGSPLFLAAMLAVTLGGVFTVSTLIGILNNGLEERLSTLRKGRSRVVEEGHTVILGWSQQIFSIVSELVIANANQRRPCIVILGDRDKVEMETEIRELLGNTGRTRIVCRSGSAMEMADLDITSINAARSIIVLSPEGDDADAHVVKALLAIINNPNRRTEPYHIVAEIRDLKNLEVARLVGGTEVELILVGGLISRIMAQTCRQSGLSIIYTELLDFGGDEIYLKREPALVGKTFGEALARYEDSAIIGVKRAGAKPTLNPPMDLRLEAGDEIIAISADDDTVRLSGIEHPPLDPSAIEVRGPEPHQPERTLILGWNWRVPSLVSELDQYVVRGSIVHVVADYDRGEADIARQGGIGNQTVTFQSGDTTDRRTLDSLNVPSFDHVILLCYSDRLSRQQADARTLITLLHLRDIARHAGKPFSITSEMLDVRNRALAEITQADDFIVSDRLISLMLAQVSESKWLNAVFEDLFDADGSEIYLRSAANYVKPGVPVTFYTVVESARRRGQVAFGYRLKAKAADASQAYGVVVNPRKSELVTFSAEDRVAVLSEN